MEARKQAGLFGDGAPAGGRWVIGVPDSGLDAALGYSEQAGIPYGIGLSRKVHWPYLYPGAARSSVRTACASS